MRTYRRNPKHTEADNVRSQRQNQNVQEDGQQDEQVAEGNDEEGGEEEGS
jgi:hypothetical protein